MLCAAECALHSNSLEAKQNVSSDDIKLGTHKGSVALKEQPACESSVTTTSTAVKDVEVYCSLTPFLSEEREKLPSQMPTFGPFGKKQFFHLYLTPAHAADARVHSLSGAVLLPLPTLPKAIMGDLQL